MRINKQSFFVMQLFVYPIEDMCPLLIINNSLSSSFVQNATVRCLPSNDLAFTSL